MAFPRKIDIDTLRELYYNEEPSGHAVARELGVYLSSVYKSMRRNNLPRRSPEETNRLRFEKTPFSFEIKTNLSFKEEKLKVAGLMLYAAEGAKSNPKKRRWTIDFANSNPRLIKVFVTFLREICRIDEKRLRGYLFCYHNQDPERLKKFWSDITDIPLEQFTKPYIRKYHSTKDRGILSYGVFHVRYSDKRLLADLEGMAREYCDTL